MFCMPQLEETDFVIFQNLNITCIDMPYTDSKLSHQHICFKKYNILKQNSNNSKCATPQKKIHNYIPTKEPTIIGMPYGH